MAKLVKSGANVLILDEPTNDLDVDTLRSLEEAIEAFGGVSIVISHDRWFLDRIATHILAFEGDSHVEWFEGELYRLRSRPEEAARRRGSASSCEVSSPRGYVEFGRSGDVDESVGPALLPIGLRVA